MQASVPIGVMLGYVLSTVVIGLSGGNSMCYHILCWRLPFLIQTILLTPLFVAFYFVPDTHLSLFVSDKRHHLRPLDPSPRCVKSLISTYKSFSADTADQMGLIGTTESSFPLSDRSASSDRSLSRSNTPTSDFFRARSAIATNRRNFFRPQRIEIDDEDEKVRKQHNTLRRHSMGASLFDPLSARNILKKSNEDLTLLGKF